jgi:hypothetical protein
MTAVEAVVAWSITNPVGRSQSRKNDRQTTNGLAGLFMTDSSLEADDPMYGFFMLAALLPEDGSNEVLSTSGSTTSPRQVIWALPNQSLVRAAHSLRRCATEEIRIGARSIDPLILLREE